MEPHATIAAWDADGKLTVYDASQGVFPTRQGLAEALGLPIEKIRVICPFVGGGFGTKGGLLAAHRPGGARPRARSAGRSSSS